MEGKLHYQKPRVEHEERATISSSNAKDNEEGRTNKKTAKSASHCSTNSTPTTDPIIEQQNSDNAAVSAKYQRRRLIHIKPRHAEEEIQVAAFSSSILAVGAQNGAIFLYETNNLGEGITETEWETGGRDNDTIKRRLIFPHKTPLHRLFPFVDSPTNSQHQHFLSGSIEGPIALWNALNGILIQQFPVRFAQLVDLATCSLWHGCQFLAAYNDLAVRLFSPERTNYLRLLPHDHPVHKIALRGRLAATADQKGTLRIWDLNIGRVAREMDKIGTNNQLQMLEFLDDDRMICVETGGNATLFNISTARIMAKCTFPDAGISKSNESEAEEKIICYSAITNKTKTLGFMCGTSQGRIFSICSNSTDHLAVQLQEQFEGKIRAISCPNNGNEYSLLLC